VRRFKLHIVIALLAFFAGVTSTAPGRQAVGEAVTFVSEQFDGHLRQQFLPLLSGH
jgi:hypothetical protein